MRRVGGLMLPVAAAFLAGLLLCTALSKVRSHAPSTPRLHRRGGGSGGGLGSAAGGGFLSSSTALAPAPPFLHDRVLVSASIYYGRISNAKISLVEILALALASNRTAVIPKLEECGADGVEASFDALFDPAAFGRIAAVSVGGYDVARACRGDSAVYLGSASFSAPPPSVEYAGVAMRGVDPLAIAPPAPPHPAALGGPDTAAAAVAGEPYSSHFAPGLRADAARYMKDGTLPDKVLAREETCVILSRNFLSVNMARLPAAFAEVHAHLVPHPSIRAEVDAFMLRHELLAAPPTGAGAAAFAPFVAVHLRMKDFLTDAGHRSFGAACNAAPDLLVGHVRDMMAQWGAGAGAGGSGQPAAAPKLVVATDDYSVPCAARLRKEFPSAILLRDASRFLAASCKAALFDQEVLAASAAFIGDGKSSFSQAIHQIRTLRHGKPPASTLWL